VSDDGGVVSFTYDGALPLSSSWTGTVAGTVSQTYNNDFRVDTQSVNGSSLSFTYDDDGLLTAAGSLSITRDNEDGSVTRTNLGSLQSDYSYSTFGELSHNTDTYSSTTLYDATYERDDLGRITRNGQGRVQ
jgi:hypothetical protein